MRIWTLSDPLRMEEQSRRPGNRQSPGAVVFRTLAEATDFQAVALPGRRPYELELTGPWEDFTSRDGAKVARAYHDWHQKRQKVRRSSLCGVCNHWKPKLELPADALIGEALIINPDTGEPV